MKKELVAEYLKSLKEKTGLTYGAIAEKAKVSESSVKNLFFCNVDDPRVDTVSPVVYALGGSMDEMLNPEKSKDEMKETSVIALKDSYEHQVSLMKEAYETQVNNIRSHYEQHHEDLKVNFEKRLSDKRELIESLQEQMKEAKKGESQQIKDLKKANLIKNIIIAVFVVGIVALFVMELMHPEHGWLRW